MHKKSLNRFSIFLNIILILFVVFYFTVSFLNYGILKTTFTPLCFLVDKLQGENYTPAWCKHLDDDLSKATNTNKTLNLNTQIANPASEECIVKGAKVEMYSNDSGQFGVCVFDDKSICEEWALYRGECKKGDCFKVCKYVGSSKEGWYISCTRQLLKLEKCGTSANTNTTPDDSMSGNVSADQISVPALIVTSPASDSQLTSPFVVEGKAKINTDKIYIRVKTTSGKALIVETADLGTADAEGYKSFKQKISYEFSTTKEGFVDIYNLGGTGAEENLVSIPVKF